MRILGIDYGKKRIGLAVSDPLFLTAQPHGYFENDSRFPERLRALVAEFEIGEIVIGHPRSMKGGSTEMTKEAEAFAEKLRGAYPAVPIHLYDERLSTAQAERFLVDADVRRDRRKLARDAIAASLVLQGWLQSRKAGLNP